MFLHVSWLWVKTSEMGAEKDSRMRILVAGALGLNGSLKPKVVASPNNLVLFGQGPGAGQ